MTRMFPPERCCPKPEVWPELDRHAWARALEPFDPFDRKVGTASRWRRSTRVLYENSYGRWLTYLKVTGILDETEAPGARASPPRVRAFHDTLLQQALAPYTIAGRLMGLSRVLAAMDPDGDFSFISIAASRVHMRAQPIKDVSLRLQPAEVVLGLGLEMMRAAEEEGRFASLEAAMRYRDGLIIAFLVYRPLRSGNLAGTGLHEQLRWTGEGWVLAFTSEEMKGKRPFDCDWPVELELHLDRYIQVHRERLLDEQASDVPVPKALWITCGGNRMRREDVYYSVRRWTAEAFGAPITPHNFRHLAASTIAADDPEGVAGIAGVLHHSSLKTSESHYNKARQIEACRQYQSTVARLRGRRRAA